MSTEGVCSVPIKSTVYLIFTKSGKTRGFQEHSQLLKNHVIVLKLNSLQYLETNLIHQVRLTNSAKPTEWSKFVFIHKKDIM
ncbi:hypothetical protein Hanom_Chr17g01537911 [Helianthus anomalus]